MNIILQRCWIWKVCCWWLSWYISLGSNIEKSSHFCLIRILNIYRRLLIDIIIVLLTHAIRWLRLYRCLEVLLSLKAICLIIKRRCSILLRLRIVTKSLLSRCSLLLYLIINYSLKLLLWSIILRCKLILWGCLCLPLIISILVL